jgi:predicted Holliday junction resolvase-like endonuclease
MDVLLIAGLAVALICIYLTFNKLSTLKRESEHLSELLVKTIKDYERELEDHKESVQELAITQARLEGIKQTTLTPDNSVPKSLHVEKVIEMSQSLQSVKAELESMTEQFEKSRGKQISERVRLGQVGENFAAFHDQFPYDRKNVKAMFQPVDLIYFGNDEIVFIDVKTGAATLNEKQRKIRDNIKNGNVRFEIHRLDENGYTIKKAE